MAIKGIIVLKQRAVSSDTETGQKSDRHLRRCGHPATCRPPPLLLASSPQPLRCAGASTKLRSSIVGWNFDGGTEGVRGCKVSWYEEVSGKLAQAFRSRLQGQVCSGAYLSRSIDEELPVAAGAVPRCGCLWQPRLHRGVPWKRIRSGPGHASRNSNVGGQLAVPPWGIATREVQRRASLLLAVCWSFASRPVGWFLVG